MRVPTLAEKLCIEVADWRAGVQEYFKTPDKRDSSAYAVTEAAEAVDADLRSRRVEDLRNKSKQSTLPEEIGDTMLMICTALGQYWTSTQAPKFFMLPLQEAVMQISMAYVFVNAPGNLNVSEVSLEKALNACIQIVGSDKAMDILKACEQRIYDRRVQPIMDDGLAQEAWDAVHKPANPV